MISEQRCQFVVDQVEISAGQGGLWLRCRDCTARQVVQLGDPTFDVQVREFLGLHPGSCEHVKTVVPEPVVPV